MANNKSLGPIQVHANDIDSINDSLRRIQDRIDDIKGLHGRTQIWDRIRADDPEEDQDVLTKGSFGTVARIEFFTWPGGGRWTQPGLSFALITEASNQHFNFSSGQVSSGQLFFYGWGSSTGVKTIQAVSEDQNTLIASISWSGHSEDFRSGEINAFNLGEDQYIKLVAATNDVGEKIVINSLVLELNG